ncbi:MAG: hypothetical protein A2X77_03655 [Gammaproteobacteria bacterium GWE2_42_36]|nr:MAG: hypothetical protein A2X77_03655 [Gammaproteobacteria bacterium GWE2_42_36]HCU05673.1 ABC transporter [Coxiellaceae bacterium]
MVFFNLNLKKCVMGLLMLSSSLMAMTAFSATEQDPLEPMNRMIFKFNEKLDKYALKPAAEFYNAAIPRPLNTAIDHAYVNFSTFPFVINDVLQANFYQSASDSWRLIVNSTVGVGGAFDVGSDIGLEKQVNSFGMTLNKWGYHQSSYLVLPVFGPSNIRNAMGLGVDIFAFSPVRFMSKSTVWAFLIPLGVIDQRAQMLRFQTVINELSIDPYVFYRDAYLQHQNYLVEQNTEAKEEEKIDSKNNNEKTDSDYYYLDE